MKVLSTALIALSVVASSASANNPVWAANVSGLQDMCDFVANGSVLNGTMTYNEGTSTFDVTSAPVVKIKTRGKNNLSVTHSNLVGDNQTQVVSVDYTGSTLTKGNNSFTVDTSSANALTTSGNNQAGTYTLTIDGKATHDADTIVIDNTAYTITHTVSCIQ